MIQTNSRKLILISMCCLIMTTLAFTSPLICYGDQYPLEVDFSPKIINISSIRNGDIRVFTDMRYATFIANGSSIFIYFNGGNESVPNIQATRDSLGHLILRFTLEDLLAVLADLVVDDFNEADVVLVMNSGDEHIGSDHEVFIVDKMAPWRH
ncbi:MAG: hypothetical protein PVI54_21035 [Desulfobacteraceae bacterium]